MLERFLQRHRQTRELPEGAAPPGEAPLQGSAVREALGVGQLQAYYQPKFDLHTHAICGVEVLAHWQHPLAGLLSPGVFMPVLERCELLDELLLSQMQQALALQKRARSYGVALNLSFKLHASQLASDGLSTRIRTLLVRYRAPRCSVTFELAEGGIIEASASSLECLVRLRMSGCNLSIDDFGTGFSSLQRLCQLPFNEIKLDGEFVRTIANDPRSRAVVSSTLALGQSLGMSVVVQGIETREQCQQLRELGCRVGQGTVYAQPMSGEALLERLTEAA
ncbi:EAL domain-containing protein [Pseudomonas putida]|uniref:EAL domain-containing protein n=1 Tax=Pseudomonas putida TaxID=303 RepID=UPI00383BDB14